MQPTERLFTTSSAARAIDCPESYVRLAIKRNVVQPLRDDAGRSLLTAAMVEAIRAHRETTLRRAA